MRNPFAARHLLQALCPVLQANMLAAGVLACLLALPGCVQVRHFNELDKPDTLRLRPEGRAAAPARPAAGPQSALRPVVVPKLGEEAPARLAPAPRVPATPLEEEECPGGVCTPPTQNSTPK